MMLTNVPGALQIIGVCLLIATIPCLWLAYRHRYNRLIPTELRYLLMGLGTLAPVGVLTLSVEPEVGILLLATGFPAFASSFSSILFKDSLYESGSPEAIARNKRASLNTMSFQLNVLSVTGAGLLIMLWLTQEIATGGLLPGAMVFLGTIGLLMGGAFPLIAVQVYKGLVRFAHGSG